MPQEGVAVLACRSYHCPNPNPAPGPTQTANSKKMFRIGSIDRDCIYFFVLLVHAVAVLKVAGAIFHGKRQSKPPRFKMTTPPEALSLSCGLPMLLRRARHRRRSRRAWWPPPSMRHGSCSTYTEACTGHAEQSGVLPPVQSGNLPSISPCLRTVGRHAGEPRQQS